MSEARSLVTSTVPARRAIASLVAVTAGLTTATAHSNPALETLGVMGSPNPFSSRVLATGAEAAYFNPALLPLHRRRPLARLPPAVR
jgi:hypothetical protein